MELLQNDIYSLKKKTFNKENSYKTVTFILRTLVEGIKQKIRKLLYPQSINDDKFICLMTSDHVGMTRFITTSSNPLKKR